MERRKCGNIDNRNKKLLQEAGNRRKEKYEKKNYERYFQVMADKVLTETKAIEIETHEIQQWPN